MAESNVEKFKELRKAFPSGVVGKIPRGGIQLDYVGHAATTDRLLEVDPEWTYEPMGKNEYGLPILDDNGGLWITLTVLGVSRPGYGDAGGKTGGNAVKEAIGDALRNAAMRFGVALDLWTKEELESTLDNPALKNEKATKPKAPEVAPIPKKIIGFASVDQRRRIVEQLGEKGMTGADGQKVVQAVSGKGTTAALTQIEAEELLTQLKTMTTEELKNLIDLAEPF